MPNTKGTKNQKILKIMQINDIRKVRWLSQKKGISTSRSEISRLNYGRNSEKNVLIEEFLLRNESGD